MSSLCLLSVDDVYEQDGLAAECLMVHKIKPRLSAAQRLPSGSHVVEACWEYKFRAHGQVNAPPPSLRAPPPPPPIYCPLPRVPPGPPGPAGGASAACVSRIPKQTHWVRAAGDGVRTVPPAPRPRAGRRITRTPPPPDPVLLLGLPSQPWELGAPFPPLFPFCHAGFLPPVLSNPPRFLSVGFLGALVFLSAPLQLILSRVLPYLPPHPPPLRCVSACVSP